MENLIRTLMAVFLIGLVVMAIVFFSIFGMMPVKKLTKVFREGDEATSTETNEPTIIASSTMIEEMIKRLLPAKEEETEKEEEEPVYQPAKPTELKLRCDYNLNIEGGEFSPAILEVNKGEELRIKLMSADKFYTIKIPAYGLSQTVGPGGEKLIAFQALSTGEFPIICEGCNEDFEAKLIVE